MPAEQSRRSLQRLAEPPYRVPVSSELCRGVLLPCRMVHVWLATLRFSGGPSSHGNTQQDAITGASRTIDVEPRLAPAKTHTPERPSAANACYAALLALEYDL